MTAVRHRRIQNLVVRMQQAFLDAPALRLTLPQAQRRFFTSAATSEAVLNMLVEAGVLSKTSRGQYVRLFPRSTGRAAA
jgi:Fic family protein